MSAAPDPAELAPSRDPAAYGRRPLFTTGFFAWIGVCLACLIVGAAIGHFGVNLSPAKSAPAVESESRQAAQSAPAPALVASPAPATTAAQTATAPPTPDEGMIGARVARLEAAQSRSATTAADALAAAALTAAAEGSAPFDQDLATFERLQPDDPDLRALAPLAALGAPSRGELSASFADWAARAAIDAKEPAKDASFLAKLSWMVSRVVIVRRVAPDAVGVDGTLYRAQLQAGSGDLEGALATLRSLPAPASSAMAGWIAAAQRRIEIDEHVAAIRARAVAALTPTVTNGAGA